MARASDVIRIANGEIGYRESGNNWTKYAKEVKALNWAQNQAWCHTFISWLFQKAEARDIAPVTASCAAGVQWFKKQKRYSNTPHVGDIVYYGPGGGTHAELVVEVHSDHIVTIGGNTMGSDKSGNYYNGNGVYRKEVPRRSSRIHGYGHPDYDAESKKPKSPPLLRRGSTGPAVKAWQKTLNKKGYSLDVDGIFGPLTEKATKDFQKKMKIDVDGIVGPITRSKV